jgi:hypothetical protein
MPAKPAVGGAGTAAASNGPAAAAAVTAGGSRATAARTLAGGGGLCTRACAAAAAAWVRRFALANSEEKRAERSIGGAGAGCGAAAALLLSAGTGPGVAVTSGAATEVASEATGMTPPVSWALGVASIAFRPVWPPSVVKGVVNSGGGGGGGAGDGGGGGLGDGGGGGLGDGGGGGLGDGGGGGLGDGGGGGGGDAATTAAAGWPTIRDEASLPIAKSYVRDVISARAVARISVAADRGGSALALDVSSDATASTGVGMAGAACGGGLLSPKRRGSREDNAVADVTGVATTGLGAAAAGTAAATGVGRVVAAPCFLNSVACCAARRTWAAAEAGEAVAALGLVPTPGAGAGAGPLTARPTRAASEDAAGVGGALGTGPVAWFAGRGAVPHPPPDDALSSLGVFVVAPILGAQKLLVPPCTTKYCGPHSQAQLSVVVPLLVYTPPR